VTVASIWSSWWPTSHDHTSAWKGWSHAWYEGVRKKSRDVGKPLVIFTDPDGSLLEHRAQPCRAACDALNALADRGIPLVLCSSRTRAELELVQQEFHLRHPFIGENGGAVYLPRGYFPSSSGPAEMSGYDIIRFAGPHEQVVEALRRTAETLGIEVRGFNGMSVQEVANECGLSLADARLAQLREYGEPFLILASDPAAESRMLNGLRRAGLRCVNRGRFHHVSSGADVRRSVRTLTNLYRQRSRDVLTIGVSAGLTDPSLLREVDIPIVVLTPEIDTARVLRQVPTARVTNTAGSLGWAEAILWAVEPQLKVPGTGRRAT